MCVTSPTRGETAMTAKRKITDRVKSDIYLASSSSSQRPKSSQDTSSRTQSITVFFFFQSRNVKIPLECDLMLFKREASLSPLSDSIYMHNEPHKLISRKQQSLTQIPGIIFFYLCRWLEYIYIYTVYIYLYIYIYIHTVYGCVCVCVCVHVRAVIWLPAYPTVCFK